MADKDDDDGYQPSWQAEVVYILCKFLWAGAVLGTCTYVVFWKGFSGWWYCLAILLLS